MEISLNFSNSTAPLCASNPPRPSRPPIVLSGEVCDPWFIGYVIVLFGYGIENNGYVNEINNKILNELECKLEFENENVNCDFYDCGDLCYGYSYPTPCPPLSPTPYPAIVDYTNSRVLLREQLVLKDIFDIVCGDNGFVIYKNENENFLDNEYDLLHGLLCPAPTATPRLTAIEFIGIDKGLPENNILKVIFGIGLCDSNGNNEICNGMFDFYCFSKFFVRSSL